MSSNSDHITKQYITPKTDLEYEANKVLTTQQELLKLGQTQAFNAIQSQQENLKEKVKKELEPIDEFDMRTFTSSYDACTSEDERKSKVLYLLIQNTRLIERHHIDEKKYKVLEGKYKSAQEDIEIAEEEGSNYISELDEKDKAIRVLKKTIKCKEDYAKDLNKHITKLKSERHRYKELTLCFGVIICAYLFYYVAKYIDDGFQ